MIKGIIKKPDKCKAQLLSSDRIPGLRRQGVSLANKEFIKV